MEKIKPIIKLRLLQCKECNYNEKCLKLTDILMNNKYATDYWIKIMKLQLIKQSKSN